jgi:hypothetical protein
MVRIIRAGALSKKKRDYLQNKGLQFHHIGLISNPC